MGTGVVWAVTKGHYLILMWAQYASLHTPATSRDRKALRQVVNDLYQDNRQPEPDPADGDGKPLPS